MTSEISTETTNKPEANEQKRLSTFELKQLWNITELAINKASQTDIPFIFLSFFITFMAIVSMIVLHPEVLAIFSLAKDINRSNGTSLVDVYFILWGTISSLFAAFYLNKKASANEAKATINNVAGKLSGQNLDNK